MNSFNLHVLAADRTFFEGDCDSLIVPTLQGQYGVQANHCNTIAAVITGVMEITPHNGEKFTAAVSNGMIKIEDNDVLVLVDTAERPEEIDENRAKMAADEAKEMLLQKRSIQEYYAAQAYFARSINRLKLKNHQSDISHLS